MHTRTKTALTTSTFIALIAIALTTSLPGTAQDEPAAEVAATAELTFDPEEVTIQAGETVQWTYEGGGTHTVTSQDGQGEYTPNGEYDYELGPETGPVNHTFDEPGTYYYYCIPHATQGMEGTVIVEEADGGGGDGGNGGGDQDGGDTDGQEDQAPPPGDGDGQEEEDTPAPAGVLALLGVITIAGLLRRRE